MDATASGRDSGAAVLAGAIAGVIAGIVLAIVMMLVNASNGADVWMGPRRPRRPASARASTPGFDGPAVLAGVIAPVLRAVVSPLVFGLAFVPLEHRLAPGAVAPWIDTRRRRGIRAA